MGLTSSRSARSSIFVGMVRDDAVLAPASGGDISISASSVVSEDASEVGSQSSLEDSA